VLRFLAPRRLVILALAALTLPIALAGCSKKVTSVDADYTELEGTPDPLAQLYVWPDVSTEVHYYDDIGTPGPSESDTLLRVENVYRYGPGVVRTMLLDGGLGSGFEYFRRSPNGAYAPMRDYVVTLPHKWLESHWELYELTDTRPSGYTPATYQARGQIEGMATTTSPLSNEARVTGTTLNSMVYTGNLFPARADTNFTMSWGDVPGAVGYWMHVMQFRSTATTDEVIQSATPAPVWNGRVRDQFVGYVAAPTTSYKLGTPGALVLTYTPPISGQNYLVRITAVDAQGQVIAYIGTNLDNIRYDPNTGTIQGAVGGGFGLVQGEGFWRIFPLGCAIVNPGGVSGAPTLARTAEGYSFQIGAGGPNPAAGYTR
jgi:hypothetical protein